MFDQFPLGTAHLGQRVGPHFSQLAAVTRVKRQIGQFLGISVDVVEFFDLVLDQRADVFEAPLA